MSSAQTERILKIACVAMGAGYLLLFAVCAYLRLAYPYEVEWMEGAMMDHAFRIIHGLPIYGPPTIDFVPWLYPPVFYYAVAVSMKIFGAGWFAGRIVSVVSSLATAALLAGVTLHATRNKLLAFFSFALFIAAYHATGYYFDIVRNDAFSTMLLVLTAYVAVRTRGWRSAISVGLLLALSFFTKQQAVFYLPAFFAWYWLHQKRTAALFAVVAVCASCIVYFVLNTTTLHWFSYYLFRIPAAKRADFSILRMFDVLPQYAVGPFMTATLAGVLLWALRRSRSIEFFTTSTGLFVMLTLSSLAAGAMSLGNEGGYKNVMMPFAAYVLPLIPIAIHQFSQEYTRFRALGYLALLLQFLAFLFNPLGEQMLFAGSHQRQGAQEFMTALAAIPGEVYIPYHGYISRQVGKPSHAHILATMDVFRMKDSTAKRLQREYDSAYTHHRFSAVILEESKVFGLDSVAGYHYARRMVAEPNINLTRVASETTRPEFLFLPDTAVF